MNEIFIPTFNQILFLLTLMLIGYLLTKTKTIPIESSKVLSILETYVFVPALILFTFVSNFTLNNLKELWQYFLAGTILVSISIIIGILLSRLFVKDDYRRKIYTYALAFPNFSFMGIAICNALYPNILFEYLIFIIPFYLALYIWAIPKLLMPQTIKTSSIKTKILNPMFISLILGVILGLLNIKLPSFLSTSISSLANIMSPVAMILTGIIIARTTLKENFVNLKIYLLSFVRLIVIPLIFIFILMITNLKYEIKLCTLIIVSMPLGLNSIVIPAAYDLDTKEASIMALLSHLMSLLTIPTIFLLFNYINK